MKITTLNIATIFFLLFPICLNANDIEIADKLLNYYIDLGINRERLEMVLEFDPDNSLALIEEAKLLGYESDVFSLKSLLEKSYLITEESKILYIEILYRLKLYNELLAFYKNNLFPALLSSEIYFFIIDSYIRVDLIDQAKILYDRLNVFYNDDHNFTELNYLLYKDDKTLERLYYDFNDYNAIIRLFTRVEHDELTELYLYKLLPQYLNEDLTGNYKLNTLITAQYNTHLHGTYELDNNADRVIDTQLTFNNHILVSKKVDNDQDGIYELQIHFIDGLPSKILINKSIIIYDHYPFVSHVYKYDEKKTYNVKGKTFPYILDDPILNDNSMLFNEIDIKKHQLKSIDSFFNNQLATKLYYLNNNDYLIYGDYINGNYHSVSHYLDGELFRVLIDLDYNEIFDYYEIYRDREMILSAYSPQGDRENIEVLKGISHDYSAFIEEISFNWHIEIE